MPFIYQKDQFENGLRFAIGESDFETLIDSNAVLLDKTEAIKELIDTPDKIILFARPRRFGKTLFMSMLKAFFEKNVNSKRHLFEPLEIWRAGEKYQTYQGRFPVIFLSFKDLKKSSFELAYEEVQALISTVYEHHRFLLESPALSLEEKTRFQQILSRSASQSDVENSLLALSRWLQRHHEQPVVLLLDEYDTPIHAAFTKGYYKEMVEFMRGFMGASFKDNAHLYRGVITGILRVVKESLFSDLNNLRVYSMLGQRYGEYFGFTQSELDQLLEKAGLISMGEEIKRWYNGYICGDIEIYNPWSIINCLSDQGRLAPYWVNTADNTLIQHMLAQAGADVKANLEKLLKGEAIEVAISEGIVFNTLKLDSDALYSFLLFTGYLKAWNMHWGPSSQLAYLAIPNQEIMYVYRKLIEQWGNSQLNMDDYKIMLQSLTTGKVAEFEHLLRRYVEASLSYFDAERKPENFYHGFILGILVGLQHTHDVRSNREAGYGRADIIVTPKDRSQLGIVLEFKRANEKAQLESEAEGALLQIEKKGYTAELKQLGISKILTIGVAFFGKRIVLRSNTNHPSKPY